MYTQQQRYLRSQYAVRLPKQQCYTRLTTASICCVCLSCCSGQWLLSSTGPAAAGRLALLQWGAFVVPTVIWAQQSGWKLQDTFKLAPASAKQCLIGANEGLFRLSWDMSAWSLLLLHAVRVTHPSGCMDNVSTLAKCSFLYQRHVTCVHIIHCCGAVIVLQLLHRSGCWSCAVGPHQHRYCYQNWQHASAIRSSRSQQQHGGKQQQ